VTNKNNTKEQPSFSSAIEPAMQDAVCWAGMKAHDLPVECGCLLENNQSTTLIFQYYF